MASITGFGGIFLRSNDSKALYQWYEQHLGLVNSGGFYVFPAPRNKRGSSSPFSNRTTPTSRRRRKP